MLDAKTPACLPSSLFANIRIGHGRQFEQSPFFVSLHLITRRVINLVNLVKPLKFRIRVRMGDPQLIRLAGGRYYIDRCWAVKRVEVITRRYYIRMMDCGEEEYYNQKGRISVYNVYSRTNWLLRWCI